MTEEAIKRVRAALLDMALQLATGGVDPAEILSDAGLTVAQIEWVLDR